MNQSTESEKLEESVGLKVGAKVGVIRMDVGELISVEERITDAWNENAFERSFRKVLISS